MDIKKYRGVEDMTYIYGLWEPGAEKISKNCRLENKIINVGVTNE